MDDMVDWIVRETPQPEFELRKSIQKFGGEYLIFVNENDIARLTPEQTFEAIEYMNVIRQQLEENGYKHRVITTKW
jgi:hypothetical protein